MFSKFSRYMAEILGSSYSFFAAFLLVVGWLVTGPFFNYSENWELFINTITTIATFLMVFLLQNTQNRDTKAVHLKLDELIRAMDNAHNKLLKIEECTDEELQELLKHYEDMAEHVRSRTKKGLEDKGDPESQRKKTN